MNGFTANYRGYADLAIAQVEGADYRVYVRTKSDSLVAVVAPHGGYIEQYTYYIARGIAGEDFNLYLFEGIRHSENYAALHLTGHPFDEPRCLELLSNCDHILAIHGCGGEAQQALIGGLDEELKAVVAQSMAALGVETLLVDHPFPATDPKNICNRNRRETGVQMEVTMSLRFQAPRDCALSSFPSSASTLASIFL